MLVEGTIKNVSYEAHLAPSLEVYNFDEFDINNSRSAGIIHTKNGDIAYSKWVTPKRTRTYPFERIYNTYNSQKRITVIPIFKDEGKDGDLDKIQFSTFSWMSLLGIFVVLGVYETAKKNTSKSQKYREKLTAQRLNNLFVKEQVKEIMRFKLEAIHWNRTVIKERLLRALDTAIEAYQKISRKAKVQIHSYRELSNFRNKILEDIEMYKEISLQGSKSASGRELLTKHIKEFTEDGEKCQMILKNYLGGDYFLTADEIFKEGSKFIIQESKNTTKSILPSRSDIKDGLFKLILYSNIDKLFINKKEEAFSTRMKLTSPFIEETLSLPVSEKTLKDYFSRNIRIFRKAMMSTIELLNREASENRNISILIARNK